MAFIAKNPLTMPEVKSAPPVPPAGTRGIYAGEDGWYEIDSNGRTKKISGAEGTGDLGRVYKYEMSCTWSLLQHGLIENDVGYPFEAGMVFNIEEDDIIPPEYTESGNAIEVLEGDNIAIASIIDGKPKFDKLSATIDLSNYVTKTELDLKVSSVYKYKGSVEYFENLPSNAANGDVWNIIHTSLIEIPVSAITVTGYDTNAPVELGHMYFIEAENPSFTSFDLYGSGGKLYDDKGNFVAYYNHYGEAVNTSYTELEIGATYYAELINDYIQYQTGSLTKIINAGDNVAWVGNEWDTLGGTIDLSNYVTKEEFNTKVSSVYKYMGSVNNYENLPTYENPSEHMGEVYNIVNGKTEVAYGLLVTDMVNSGYGDNMADEYTYLNLDEANKFTVGNKVSVFNQDGKCLGSFVVQSTYETEVSEQLVAGGGLYEICVAIAEEQGDYFCSGSFCDVHRKYYFSNIAPTSYDSKTLFSINPGANVAWTGADWDMLGGTVDLSAYATKDYVDTMIGTALEGEY